MLQEDEDGATRAALIAFFAAAWTCRAAARLLPGPVTVSELIALVDKSMRCPWLNFCTATLTRKERRAARVREPPEIGLTWAASRADGSCQGADRLTGWGAAYWPPGTRGLGPCTESKQWVRRHVLHE